MESKNLNVTQTVPNTIDAKLSDFYELELIGIGSDEEIRKKCVESAQVQFIAIY